MSCQHLAVLSTMGFCWNRASSEFYYPQKYTDWSNGYPICNFGSSSSWDLFWLKWWCYSFG
eukprot:10006388-Ditylum_brightwellii.AAC.1